MDRQAGNKEVYEADIYYNAKWKPEEEIDLGKGGNASPCRCLAESDCRPNIVSKPKEGSFKARIAKKLQAEKEKQKRIEVKPKKKNLNFRELKESRRVYVFPGNNRVIVENACRIAIMDSGIHRIETTTGEKHIIPTGWLQIKINSKEWNF
jgi:hypothetical protein